MAARLQIDQLRTGSQLTLHLSLLIRLYSVFPNKKPKQKSHFHSENELFCAVCVNREFSTISYFILFIFAPLGHGR
jgi:hypothetical protein